MSLFSGFRRNHRRISSVEQQRETEDAVRMAKPGFKRLHNQVKESSDNNRQFFFAYLALMVFVQSMVISTTDKMLLLSFEGIKLPLIDLMVPLLGFYWVVPFFVLALHFNFLHNLDSHHYKLMQWRYAFPDARVPRSRIHAFLFDFAMLEQDTPMASLLHGINAFLCLYLGPVTLALVLWRMTDYQDAGLTTLHSAAFIFNCLLVWKTLRGFAENAQAAPENLAQWGDASANQEWAALIRAANARRASLSPLPQHWSRWIFRGLISLCIALVLAQALLGIAVAKLSSQEYRRWFGTLPSSRPTSIEGRLVEMMLPRLYIDPNDVIFEVNDVKLKALSALAGQQDWVKWFHSAGLGLDLRERSLRGAQLSHQLLPRALFEGTQMEGANFAQTQLQGANFWLAQLEGADFSGAKLQAANFWFAKLQGATFRGANLREAKFEFAQMNRTSFYGAQLQGADFSQAQPQRADFRFSAMQNVNFSSAQMERADFASAELQGAIFHGAQMLGADFSDAKLSGADMDGAQLQGAIGLDVRAPLLGEGPTPTALTAIDWERAKAVADTMLDPRARSDFLENLAQARKRAPLAMNDLPKANHAAVAPAWVVEFCVPLRDRKQEEENLQSVRSLLQMGSRNLSERGGGSLEVLESFEQLLCEKPMCRNLRTKLQKDAELTCKKDQ